MSQRTSQSSWGAEAFTATLHETTPQRDVFSTHWLKNTFMGYHPQVHMHTRWNHDTEKSGQCNARGLGIPNAVVSPAVTVETTLPSPFPASAAGRHACGEPSGDGTDVIGSTDHGAQKPETTTVYPPVCARTKWRGTVTAPGIVSKSISEPVDRLTLFRESSAHLFARMLYVTNR